MLLLSFYCLHCVNFVCAEIRCALGVIVTMIVTVIVVEVALLVVAAVT